MFCTNCGQHNSDSSNYCFACGTKLVKPEHAPTVDKNLATDPKPTASRSEPDNPEQNRGRANGARTGVSGTDLAFIRALEKQGPIKPNDRRLRAAAEREWDTGKVDRDLLAEVLEQKDLSGESGRDEYVKRRMQALLALASSDADPPNSPQPTDESPKSSRDGWATPNSWQTPRAEGGGQGDRLVKEARHSLSDDTFLKGRLGLPRTFWLFGMLPFFAYNLLIGMLEGMPPEAYVQFLTVTLPIALAYQGMIVVAVWNASDRYSGPDMWAILAKVFAVIWGIGILVGVGAWNELRTLL